MAKVVDKLSLAVSPLTGEVYITALDKEGCMTDNRRKLERCEVLNFIHSWSEVESDRLNNDTITIVFSGVPVLEIKLNKDMKEQSQKPQIIDESKVWYEYFNIKNPLEQLRIGSKLNVVSKDDELLPLLDRVNVIYLRLREQNRLTELLNLINS